MSAKKQSTLHSFFSSNNNRNANNGNNRERTSQGTLTPEEKARIEKNRQEGLRRRQAYEQRQRQNVSTTTSSSSSSSTLTPALNRMQMVSPSATPATRTPLHPRREPNADGVSDIAVTTDTPRNGRKRTRHALNGNTSGNMDGNAHTDYEESSPIHPRKRLRTAQIVDDDDEEGDNDNDDDEDYVPMDDVDNKQHESDAESVSYSASVSSKRSRSTKIKTNQSKTNHNMNPKQENDNNNDDEDEDDEDAVMGDDTFGYEYDALAQDPDGELTMDRLAEFQRLDDDHHNHQHRAMQRDPQFTNPNANAMPLKSTRHSSSKKTKKSAGASHRNVSAFDWYRNPTDFSGRLHSLPGANKAEIKIPATAFKKMTPSQQQYWNIKRSNFDGILFFKVGKFYELYNCDADLAHKMCGLNYMGQDNVSPHVGFPETSFNKYAEMFINYGQKVYRVEQTETTVQQKARKHKLVDREVCEVLSKGTLVLEEFLEDSANFILSIVEQAPDAEHGEDETARNSCGGSIQIAVCFMDFSTGHVFLGTFSDDRNRARLRTLIFQYRPTQCLYKRDSISAQTLSLLKNECRSSVLTALLDEDEFFSAPKTQSLVQEHASEYFPQQLPDVLQDAWHDALSMHAFGAILYMLQHTMHDREILPHSHWHVYDPTSTTQSDFLTLDGSTLANLEILYNDDGTRSGTLYEFVEKCHTKFGKRMLEQWLRAPLRRAPAINERLDAIEYLMTDAECWTHELQIEARLRELPDLERLLHTLNVLSTKQRMMDKAVMFDDCWQKSKVEKLLAVMDGFENVAILLAKISERSEQITSSLVKEILTVADGGNSGKRSIPCFSHVLDEFKASFDFQLAKGEKSIEPTAGHNAEFDTVRESILANKTELDKILEGLRRKLKSTQVKFFHKKNGKLKDQYQLEVPKTLKFLPPDEFHPRPGTKSVDRYHSDEILELLDAQERLKNKEALLLKDAARATFARFATHERIWRRIVENMAVLDCLLSLANVSACAPNLTMTRPQFVVDSEEPFLEMRDAQHPCIVSAPTAHLHSESQQQQFIPNDTVLGCKENGAPFVILTGPNMGGKSTVLRQTCVAVILAHIGCYVPCTLMRLSAVDRIFTRVGANDRILAGQSTFMVELEETANILQHATKHSLVILDELGRGTSTFDGTGIAYAVAKQLIDATQCRCLFSTHYHGLCDSFMECDNVAMYHMAYTKNAHNDDITFLYKLRQGICKQSHGINCAKMAGFPLQMLQNAQQKANELHQRMHGENDDDDERLLQKFKAMMCALFSEKGK
eukprot:CAMPEP_0202694696 /NCGR_PEP_ID=MMETSP1385-20130828/8485_1 /ASSEMBLY_ACC=CAM_ASM_000861 /TAXON_ID=933848 /ORGANISM="Elphidium margaritaceum" /LENGTH=1286 /DNA_ID=CAMNT_0049350589 /DNA_START=36 /DNA_END=3896 /DNA_ORIENTATION=+